MKKTKIILMLITMLLTIMLSVYISFAWFDMIKSTKPIIINTGSLRLSSSFFNGVDINEDGIIQDSEYTAISSGGITFNAVLPGDTLYFRIRAKNLGDIDGTLSIIMNNIIISNTDILDGYVLSYTLDSVEHMLELSDVEGTTNLALPLIEDIPLGPKAEFILDFKLSVKTTYQATWRGEPLKITNYIIRLVQEY